MRIVYLVTSDNVKVYAPPINLNIEDSIVAYAIIEAQRKIKKLIGADLYTKIEDLFINGMGDSGNENYKTLFEEYMYFAIIRWALVESLAVVRWKIHNKGTNVINSENTQTAEYKEFEIMRDEFTNKAEEFSADLINYLNDNSSLYPEYYSCSTCHNSGSKQPYFSGIQFY